MMNSLTLFSFLTIPIFLSVMKKEYEPVIRQQVQNALKIKDPTDRENVIVNIILTERQLFVTANQKTESLVQETKRQRLNDAQYKIIPVVRTRIEDVVDNLFPKHVCQPTSYKEKVKIILKSGSFDSFPLLEDVKCRFSPFSIEKCIELFAESVEQLFGKTSAMGDHKVYDSSVLEILQTCEDDVLVEYLRLLFKVRPNENNVKTLRIISTPLPISNQNYSATLKDHCCIRITPIDQQRTFNRKTYDIQEKDVQELFPTTKVNSTEFDHDAEQNILSIKVHFENTNEAVIAYNENHGWLKRVKIQTEIISCQTEAKPSVPSPHN